jgi:hypothetical protein
MDGRVWLPLTEEAKGEGGIICLGPLCLKMHVRHTADRFRLITHIETRTHHSHYLPTYLPTYLIPTYLSVPQ